MFGLTRKPRVDRASRRALRVGLLAALVVALLGPEAIARAQTAPFCAAGQTPQFQFGFAALRAAVGDPVGEPTECEHPDADGNALQKTTTGSLFWQRSTNTPVFTAGDQHWALTANGLVQWSGPSMQPPVSAAPGATGGADQQQLIAQNSARMMEEGRRTFRFDTFGSEAFWGDALRLHQAIAGQKLGGVGPGVSPKTALQVGLKVDMDALPAEVVEAIKAGKVDLDDPATTVTLLKLNAVVGVMAFANPDGSVRSMGIQCALCHSTVDDAFAPGIGHRLDGWPNRDLNVGAIIALAPDTTALTTLLGVDKPTLLKVLNSWGPGKFDAELVLDGKAFRPDGKPAATLLPPAFGLAGVNNHTWTGSWGTVTYWNAFVANLEMHGQGTFFDPRLNDPNKYPIAAKAKLGNVRNANDQITSKLAALHFYQLAIPAPTPPAGSFDAAAAQRGQAAFNAKAQCATCHVPPLFTEPGWNLHTPAEIGIDDFQANRSPNNSYRTAPLRGLFAHSKGGFYHDGRFATLRDVVNSYNARFRLNLSDQEANDLVEYLKSL